MTFDLLCCQNLWPTYHLYHFALYAFTRESTSLAQIHIACLKFNAYLTPHRPSVRALSPRIGSSSPPCHSDHVEFLSGDCLVESPCSLASYPVRLVILHLREPEIVHRFVQRFPEAFLNVPASKQVCLILCLVASSRSASGVGQTQALRYIQLQVVLPCL